MVQLILELFTPMSENFDEDDDGALQARLNSLKQGLHAHRAASEAPKQSDFLPKADNMSQAMSLGMRVLAEFVGGVAVGALLGWQFDKWFGTSPVLLIIFLALGTVAGFWNVYRIAAAPTVRKVP